MVCDNDHIIVLSLSGAVLHSLRIRGLAESPAIGDIDLDGRNEIVYATSLFFGFEEYLDHIWALDLGGENHGAVKWGQFLGSEKHAGIWPVP